MNKQDLIKAISASFDPLARGYVETVIDEVFGLIEGALGRGEDVRITNFGTFKRVATKARTCRNPKTGEAIEVPAGQKIKFKASGKLKV